MKVCDPNAVTIQVMRDAHARSGFDYSFPRDLHTPLFPIKRSVEKDDAVLAMAAIKVEGEAYLWINPSEGTPEERWIAIKLLCMDLELKAREIGFDQVHCALPPEIAERFGKRLEDLGWKIARPWPLYVFQLR